MSNEMYLVNCEKKLNLQQQQQQESTIDYKKKYFEALQEKQQLTLQLEKYKENTIVKSMNSMKSKYDYLKKNTIDKSYFTEIFSRYKNIKNQLFNVNKLTDILFNASQDNSLSLVELKVYLNIIHKLNTDHITNIHPQSSQTDSDLEDYSESESVNYIDNDSDDYSDNDD